MTTNGHALIIASGIAGPTMALALKRAGIDVGVFEAHDRPANYTGLFLNTASNGLDALRASGVEVTESADGFPIPRMVMWSGAGKRLGEVANGVSLADGTVSICVRRALLQKTLRDQALDRGIPIQYGKRLDSYTVTDTGVMARFTDGTEASGDILVGADGIHSRTRQLLNPDAPRPRFTGMLSIGGYSRVPGLPPTTGTQHFGSPTCIATTSQAAGSCPRSRHRSGGSSWPSSSLTICPSSAGSSRTPPARSAPTRCTTSRPARSGTAVGWR